MDASLHELTRTYVCVDGTLKSDRIFSERNRQQLEMLRDELRQEIVTAVRAKMKADTGMLQ
jgi:hypothetical protein